MSWLTDLFHGPSVPAAPNTTPMLALSNEVGQQAMQLSNAQYGWAQGVYNTLSQNAANTGANANNLMMYADNYAAQNAQAANDFYNTATRNNDFSNTAQVVYQNTSLPQLMKLSQEANTYDTPEREAYEVNRAQAGVAQQFEGQRQAALNNLESYGISPSSTRYAALDLGARVAQGAAAAGAGNQAALQHEQTARNLRTNVVQLGQSLPGQASQADTVANSATSGAVNTNQTSLNGQLNAGQLAIGSNNSAINAAQVGGALMGTAPGYLSTAGNSAVNMANIQNQGYGQQMQNFNANQNSSSGLGSLLGTAAGAATRLFLAEGGAVPVAAQPKGAPAIDGVPANLTVGEFVIPEDVAKWKGEEFFQGLIKKSREAKHGATAKPAPGAPRAANQRPTFQSRPAGGGALPIARAA
ncbi:MAG: hypothetical protein ACXWP0_16370 [Ktedonobacterales bacterium]